MHMVNIYEAKTHLSQLIQQSLKGEEIIIGKAGHPLVKLVPIEHVQKARKPGIWKGKVKIAPDFDTLPDEVLKAFEGDDT